MKSKAGRSHYYDGLQHLTGSGGRWTLEERWSDIGKLLTLRPQDEVLDVGCAEGLITVQVAKQVRHVDALDVGPERIALAERIRREGGVTNIKFSVASIVDLEIPELSYDVILFLGVIQHLPEGDQIRTLEKLLRATKREIAIRAPLHASPRYSHCREIIPSCEKHGFRVTDYQSSGRAGNLILAKRPE